MAAMVTKESNNGSKPAFKYLNYRCHKCGKYVSHESKTKNTVLSRHLYLLCSKQYHDCSEGLQDDEKALLELVSISSEHPIGELF